MLSRRSRITPDQQLVNYIQKRQSEEADRATIQAELEKVGWDTNAINTAFENLHTIPLPNTIPLQNSEYPNFLGPIDLFKKAINIFHQKYPDLISTPPPSNCTFTSSSNNDT